MPGGGTVAPRLCGFVPVLTFRFPLDELLTPYVERLCSHALISVPELQQRGGQMLPAVPLLIDSGGFAALLPGAVIEELDGLGVLVLPDGRRISPQQVQAAQETYGSIGFTLDFPGPPDIPGRAARAWLSLANARWALQQPRSFELYASVQPGQSLGPYLELQPDGIALGGLAPCSRDRERLTQEVLRVRAQTDLPLHVFGIGHPESVRTVMQAGADSCDSSSPQRTAAGGRSWRGEVMPDAAPHERLRLAILNLQASSEAGRVPA
ncbi:hypothetical protein [Deinococcus ruber]|uniref:tRNA-guanine(15) transglycosylase-like domain-containing protein n=1 Tax=Deinococcus ruber TaxID=1848197 RepID=A0A918FAU9_9DEIO|nr:hypothetical protein [Deinococcus ruber]GGR17163.1 hypothetical protein GCM10008957_32210 [Deinococcus ruber]